MSIPRILPIRLCKAGTGKNPIRGMYYKDFYTQTEARRHAIAYMPAVDCEIWEYAERDGWKLVETVCATVK